jgi:hypothetical protein
MCDRIHYFEACKNCDGKQSLSIVRNEWQFPADEDSQRDEKDQSAEDVANDRKRMGPLSCRGNASDPAQRADGHTDDDEQDNVHAHVGE